LSFRNHVKWLILNLTSHYTSHKFTVIQLHDKAYKKGSYLHKLGFKHSHIKTVAEGFRELGLVEWRNHSNTPDNPRATRLRATEKLLRQSFKYNYSVTYNFTPPYVTCSSVDKDWAGTMTSVKLDGTHPDIQDMNKINEFLQAHTWANKGPVRLKYKLNPFTGGRLYTPFQNLRSRKVNERLRTLIDGEPIAEVDFNANHLRLSLAIFAKQDAGDSPYEDIMAESGESRDSIKSFITRAMGAECKEKAFSSMYRLGWDVPRCENALAATYRCFPKIILFDGIGVKLQSLEGSILRRVILRGVDRGIVCLPVHDAIACKVKDAEWVKQVMKEEWETEVGGIASPRLKIETNDT
jgi:hypothetical protein